MENDKVDIIPLGGLGEIGLNMMVMECGDHLLVIDVGLMFPEEGMYGVDVVIPDFQYLIENKHRVRAVVLTHGHEDHIGALPFLLRRIDVPVYGTKLTLELVKEKLKEHQLDVADRLHLIRPRQIIEIGPFQIETISVSHSIVDGVALAIETPVGRFVHSGDFKIEQNREGGGRTDLAKFAEYGEKGVLCLLSDSTNVERPGYTMSESDIGRAFRDIFRTCRGRIIVACFASSLIRIQQVIDVAAEFGRKIAFDGKSMICNVNMARSMGYLTLPEDMEVTVGGIKSLPDDMAVLVTTGTQGEPMSALTRMASEDHKKIKIKKGDTVILSSRFIPGNERAITNNINNLYRLGANVIYESVSDVHVSGHAYQEELKLMINLTRPRFFIPIHGEYRHLIKHAELASVVGVDRENCLLVEDGHRIRFDGHKAEFIEKINTGRVLVDGKGVGDVGQIVLRDRRNLAEHGMVIVLLVIDESTTEILIGPEIISKGFVFEEDPVSLLEDAKCLILEIFDRLAEEREEEHYLMPDLGDLKTEIQRELKRFFHRIIERRPLIIAEIMTV